MKKVLLLGLLILIPFMPIVSKEKIDIENFHINYINEYPIGKLIIKKININEYFYNINSDKNTIEKHISILKESIFPDQENSILFIAAHSGTGKIAYFQNLDKLEENDEITIVYKKKKYIYLVKDIWEEKKNGYINVNKEIEDQLILTTCSPNKDGYQLIVNCIKKESN